MSDPIPLYTIQRSITDTDVDFARRQKLSSMFGMFQDIAAFHAANLGASVTRLHDDLNVAWILMRIRAEVDRYPMLRQDVTVETWPQAPRAMYERDYVIRDENGEALVRAGSVWIIMDLNTREIRRDRLFDYFGIDLKKDRALEKGVARLKPVDGASLVRETEIKYSDVDYNGHLNNAKYVDYITDSYTFEEHRAREIKAIEVHYINEVRPGGGVKIYRKTLDGGADYIDGVNSVDGAQAFNALVEWG